MTPILEERGKARLGLGQARWLQQHYSLREGGWPGPVGAVAVMALVFAATLQPLSALLFGAFALHGLICIRRPSQPEPWAPAVAPFLFPAYAGIYLAVMIVASLIVSAKLEWLEVHGRSLVAVPPLFYGKTLVHEAHTVFFWVLFDLSLPLGLGLWFHAARRLPYRFHAVYRVEKRYPMAAEPDSAVYRVNDRQLRAQRAGDRRVFLLISLMFGVTMILSFGLADLLSAENTTLYGRAEVPLFDMPGFWIWNTKVMLGLVLMALIASNLVTEVFEPGRERLKGLADAMARPDR